MLPTASRLMVKQTVFIPSRAAARAASMPACPAPMTAISNCPAENSRMAEDLVAADREKNLAFLKKEVYTNKTRAERRREKMMWNKIIEDLDDLIFDGCDSQPSER